MSHVAKADPRIPPPRHPWERARQLAFDRWEQQVRRTPFGRPLPDAVGFASTVEPPLQWSDAEEGRRLFAFSALPLGSGSTYLATVLPPHRRPPEGALVRLSKPLKKVLPTSDAAFGELLIEARGGTAPAAWEEILEGVPRRNPTAVVAQLSELWRLPPPVIEALLLPLVGSMPWHGRPAGQDLYLEVEGWSLAQHRKFLSSFVELVPEWVRSPIGERRAPSRALELVSGARIRRSAGTATRPFSIRLRAVNAAPAGPARTDAPPRSIITYGKALTPEFEAILSAGDTPMLVTAAEADHVPSTAPDVPDSLRAAVWALHWWAPEVPDAPEWYRWLRSEEPRLRHALDEVPVSRPGDTARSWSAIVDHRGFRDRLAQSAFARARLRAASDVEHADLARTVDSFVTAIQRAAAWASEGRGPLSRALDRTEGGRTARLRRTLEGLLQAHSSGLTVEEALATLRSGGISATEWDVENQLERMRIRGNLFQDRSRRYHPA